MSNPSSLPYSFSPLSAGLGRNVTSAKFNSIKNPLTGKALALNEWVYSDLGALQRDHDFADKAVRLHFDDCPNARSLQEVAGFPAPAHVAILEAHLWTAIRAARRDKRWKELDLEGMVQVWPLLHRPTV